MGKLISESHMHLWGELRGCVNGTKIESLGGGRSTFMGGDRQMMPPYMIDGKNTAELFISNMNYAGVSGAVVTQEYIDGNQNAYLLQVKERYPELFKVCGLFDHRIGNEKEQIEEMIRAGFDGVKVAAQRMVGDHTRAYLNTPHMIEAFKILEAAGLFLSIDLDDGDNQVQEMKEVIAACPNLRIAIGHFGMVTRPNWQEQIKLARHNNVVIESGGITWLFHKEFYPYQGASRALRESIELVGEDKLLWGSDYPRTMTAITYKMSWDFVEKSKELSEEQKSKFLGQNAYKFYGFKNLQEKSVIKNMVED